MISKNYLENYHLSDAQTAATKEVINAELEMLSNLYDGRVLIIDSSFKEICGTIFKSAGRVTTELLDFQC